MSHIVIHDDETNGRQYAQFSDVPSAAAYLEELHNSEGASNARLFAMEEVHFAVKSYVKVEIGEIAAAEATAAVAETEVETAEDLLDAVPDVFTDTPIYEEVVAPETLSAETSATEIDTVEYVEAAMAPVDVFAPTPQEEPRRGLFGR